MNEKKGTRKNQAVAGVIEALLLVALVSIIIATIQLVYIPQVMNEREAEHMDDVSNQFSYMKSMIDIQSITQSDVPMFSMLTLGSDELPYFLTARADGEVKVIAYTTSKISIDYGSFVFPLTSIVYDARNAYFVDQTYALEGGGIIVKQPEGKPVMRVNPSISITNGSSLVTIYINLPVFSDIPGKNETYGYGSTKCVIRTNYSSSSTQPISGVSSIQIYTDYTNAWNESLITILEGAAQVSEKTNYVEITKKTKDINVEIKRIQIYAQIGPGWVV
jgi:hypothetical protein